MKVGVLAILIAILLPFGAMAGPAPDSDSDGTVDLVDCCSADTTVPSLAACDIDVDGYCGPCDGDMTNDGAVDFLGLGPFGADLSAGFDSGIGSDMNCDGATDFLDLGPFGAQLSAGAPGPSGLPCAGTVPCP
jgi:hypothetical protein